MKRISYKDVNGQWTVDDWERGITQRGPAIDLLASYENTGLEPQDYSKMFVQLLKYKDLGSFNRLRELAEADKDGRCGVCPVKLHQHIYRIFNGEILDEMVCSAMFEPFTPRPRWKIWTMGGGLPYYWEDVFNKTVFLTREAAKAALEARHE